jgi:integrase/recombinase XerC
MVEQTRALVLHDGRGGDAVDRMKVWKTMARDECRRRAMAAALAHDTDELWSLADAYLTLKGRAGTRTSEKTRERYHGAIDDLVDGWATVDMLHPDEDAGQAWVSTLQASTAARGAYQPSTIRVYLAAGRLLYRALRWARATTADPFGEARAPHDSTASWEKRAAYGEDEVSALLAVIDRREAEGGPAAKTMARLDRVLVLLGAHGALRASEMLGLRWSDINMTTKELVVAHGKGDKLRTVVLSKGLRQALAAIPHEHRGEYVLPYRTRQAAWYRVKRLAEEAGVAERGLHSLRHTAGTRLYGQTHDLLQVAAQLGHAHVETSRTYAKRDRSELHQSVGEWT